MTCFLNYVVLMSNICLNEQIILIISETGRLNVVSKQQYYRNRQNHICIQIINPMTQWALEGQVSD